jgi:peptide/nickel transport system ATP-binding protein
VSAPAEPTVLQVTDLSISFTTQGGRAAPREVVHHVGFTLERGRVLALVGESGSGKSVTAMATLRLLPNTAQIEGSVRLGSEELLSAPAERLRRVRGGLIGTVFQEPMGALNPVFTIGDQIAESLLAHHRGLDRPAARRRVHELLDLVAVTDPARVARSFPHELSGGQLQRAMIAMAISNNPQALIADEPTTALDVTVQAEILALLRDLKDRLGMAVLLITHDMGVVADIADDVAVMRDGQIVERADVLSVFKAPQHDYTKALLAAVPRLPSLRIAEPAPAHVRHPARQGVAAAVEDATIIYRGRGRHQVRAAESVTLHIAPGEVVGLVGESGSGKSTVGRALAGLVPLASGRAVLAGVDLSEASRRTLREVRAKLGIVFQDPASSLNPRHTIERSIGEPLDLHQQLSAAQRHARVLELLDAVQLDRALAGRLPHELSGGQRQRVAIARAISTNPDLLIADEPTSALDVSVQARILALFGRLQADFGFACLFISHDLAVVGEVTSRVAVMYRGSVVEEGPTDQTLTAPTHPYTRRLLAAAPVPDPVEQRRRREAWLALQQADAAAA